MSLKDGRVSRISRSQPAMTGANDLKSQVEIMSEIGAGMKRCNASMLQPRRHASRQGHFRVRPRSADRAEGDVAGRDQTGYR